MDQLEFIKGEKGIQVEGTCAQKQGGKESNSGEFRMLVHCGLSFGFWAGTWHGVLPQAREEVGKGFSSHGSLGVKHTSN